jgi:hypothetical protein
MQLLAGGVVEGLQAVGLPQHEVDSENDIAGDHFVSHRTLVGLVTQPVTALGAADGGQHQVGR